MTGIGLIDLTIGLIFLCFFLSLIVTATMEIRSQVLGVKAKELERWLNGTFCNKSLTERILSHDLIKAIGVRGRKIDYIPKTVFVNVLLDVINQLNGESNTYNIDSIQKSLIQSTEFPEEWKRMVLQNIYEVKTLSDQSTSKESQKIEDFKLRIETWFGHCMNVLNSQYRNVQMKSMFGYSFIVVLLLNADAITLSKFFYSSKETRSFLVQQASRSQQDSLTVAFYQHVIESSARSQNQESVVIGQDGMVLINAIKGSVSNLRQVEQELRAQALPLGWKSLVHEFNTVQLRGNYRDFIVFFLMKIVGLIISVFVISVGSPFWFDIFNRLVNLKGAGDKPLDKK